MNASTRSTRWFNAAGLWNGLTLGPLAAMSALLVMVLSGALWTGTLAFIALVCPTAIFLILALISLVRRGDTSWWVFSVVGSVLGTVLVCAAILGTISGIAWMLSDPG